MDKTILPRDRDSIELGRVAKEVLEGLVDRSEDRLEDLASSFEPRPVLRGDAVLLWVGIDEAAVEHDVADAVEGEQPEREKRDDGQWLVTDLVTVVQIPVDMGRRHRGQVDADLEHAAALRL